MNSSAFQPLSSLAFDENLQTSLHVVGSLSVTGCLLVFAAIWYTPKLRTPINAIICWLTFCDFGLSMAQAFGTASLSSYGPDNLLPTPCLLQGMAIQFFDLAICIWNVIIPLHCYFLVHSDAEKVAANWRYYHVAAWGIPCIFLILLYVVQVTVPRSGYIIGSATLVCWISNSYDDFRIYLFYIFLWLQLVTILGLYCALFYKVKELTAGQTMTPSASKKMKRMIHKAICFAVGFMICWLPATCSRFLAVFGRTVPYWLFLLQSLTMPAHGLADSITFLVFAYTRVQGNAEIESHPSEDSYEMKKMGSTKV